MILYEKGSTTAEASGTTFTLQDTSNERKLSFKKYYGNTTQETTSGKNIAGVTSGSGYLSLSGDTLTFSSGASSSSFANLESYTLTANQTYTFSIFIQGTNTNSSNINVLLRDIDNNTICQITGNKLNSSVSVSFTPTSNVELYRIQFYASSSAPTTDAISCKVQLEKGNQSTSYQEFTYGPTPNPYYPQPINVVTGDNTISVVGGKNLFSGFIKGYSLNATNGLIASSSTSAISEPIPVDFDTYSSYYINGLTNTFNSLIAGYNEKFEFIGRTSGTQRTSTEIKPSNMTSGTPQGTGPIKYIIVTQYKLSTQTGTIDDIDNLQVMLNTGSTPLTYEAYIGQKYEVNLGKNLLSLTDGTYSNNSVTAVVSNGVMTISGTANGHSIIDVPLQTIIPQSAGILMKSLNATGTYTGLQTSLRASNGTTNVGLWTTDALSKEEILTGDAYKFRIQVNSGVSVDCTIKSQIEHGITITPFSPYKTPIELCKIGTYQDTIFKSSGINMFDLKSYLDSCNVTYTENSDGSLTFSPTTYVYQHPFEFSSENTNVSLSGIVTQGTIVNFKIKVLDSSNTVLGSLTNSVTKVENKNGCKLQFDWGTSGSVTLKNIMLNKGTTALPYEPYGKDWYIKKEIGKVVLDGSEYWASPTQVETSNYYRYENQDFRTNNCLIHSQYLSNNFKYNNTSWQTQNNVITNTSTANANRLWITIDTTLLNGTTVADFKTWLSTHNTIVYYVLNTPTYTKITDEELLGQIEALENATTYDNVTNILQYNANLPLYVDIEYLKPLDFSRNGLGYLPNVLNAYVTDEINGEYSLTFEYPIEDRMASEIVEDRIVKCKVADGSNQCFIIKKIQKNFDKMNVYCTHLFYMLYDDFLEDTYPQNLSPKPFLDHILSRANYQLPFVANSDIATTKTARYVRKNVVETILGNINNSMYNLWGLELKRDNWNIGLKARLGSNKGEKLIFGKNITGVDVSVDTTGIYTRIMPIGFDGLLLPEKYIDAPNIDDYPYPRICLYEFSNIRYDANEEDTEAYHTLDEAYQALRDATQELFDKGINKPKINIKVDWLELSKTEEFKQYSALERVDLGDTLTSNLFGMDYETRVIKTIYNPLNDRIEQFEIGTFKPSITTEMNQLNFDVVNLPSSMLDEAQANATQLITQAMGGYVYKTNSELYIMDTNDPATAQNVWRWNINGLGYSSTGINGPYGLAMTMDGAIVADFITAGQIDTNVINGYDSLTTQVYANTNNLDNVNSDLQQYKSQVSTQFVQTANDFSFQFNNINQLINDVSNTTSDSFNEINKYIRFVNGVIVLGEEGNEMTAELSNDKLSFKQNGTEIAYVSNNKLYITNAEMLYNLVIGNFQFIPRNNGSLSFRRVG